MYFDIFDDLVHDPCGCLMYTNPTLLKSAPVAILEYHKVLTESVVEKIIESDVGGLWRMWKEIDNNNTVSRVTKKKVVNVLNELLKNYDTGFALGQVAPPAAVVEQTEAFFLKMSKKYFKENVKQKIEKLKKEALPVVKGGEFLTSLSTICRKIVNHETYLFDSLTIDGADTRHMVHVIAEIAAFQF